MGARKRFRFHLQLLLFSRRPFCFLSRYLTASAPNNRFPFEQAMCQLRMRTLCPENGTGAGVVFHGQGQDNHSKANYLCVNTHSGNTVALLMISSISSFRAVTEGSETPDRILPCRSTSAPAVLCESIPRCGSFLTALADLSSKNSELNLTFTRQLSLFPSEMCFASYRGG